MRVVRPGSSDGRSTRSPVIAARCTRHALSGASGLALKAGQAATVGAADQGHQAPIPISTSRRSFVAVRTRAAAW